MASWTKEIGKRLSIARSLATEQGSDPAPYTPGEATSANEVAAFEKKYGVSLPADYREFLVAFGPGVGPEYGLCPLAPHEPTEPPSITATVTGKGVKGVAKSKAKPPLARRADMTRPFVEGSYDGCIELAEIGCGYMYFLAISGPHAGEVWMDETAADLGFTRGPAFRTWIDRWIEETIGFLAQSLATSKPERPGKAKAALKAALPIVEEAVVRIPALLEALGHVKWALGDAKGALAILAKVDSSALRRAVYAKDIASAAKSGPPALAKHRAREVRLALAANSKIPAALVKTLANDADVDVRSLAARHPNADPKLVLEIVKKCLASRELGLESAVTLELALRHPKATAALVDEAIESCEERETRFAAVVLRGAALSPAATKKHRARLVKSRWPEVRHALARARATEAEIVRVLVADPDRAVRAAVAARRDLPGALLAKLAEDADKSVRDAVAGNPGVPPATLVALVANRDHHWYGRNNPNAPKKTIDAFEKLIGHDHDDREVDERDAQEVRDWAEEEDVDNVASTVPAVDVVATGKVRHWSFPVAALPSFMDAHMAAYSMAGRPWLSAEIIAVLARDPYQSARCLLAANPETPAAVVERIAREETPISARGAAGNPKLPLRTLLSLVDRAEPEMREDAAMSPNIPLEALERLATDKVAYVRRGVVRSPNVSPKLLAKLASDKSEDVRRWVPYAASVTPALLKQLSKDEDDSTRGRALFRLALV